MSTQNQNLVNVKLQVVKEIETETGGLVIIYLATPESILKEFYLASFDDKFMEVAWGIGDTIEEALYTAEKAWNQIQDNEEEDSSGNPFTEAIKKLNEGEKLTKEELIKMCKAIEKTARSENGEDVQICHFTEHDRVWIDAKDLDWLADDVDDPTAKKLRDVMKYSTDFQGGYYYYDFESD